MPYLNGSSSECCKALIIANNWPNPDLCSSCHNKTSFPETQMERIEPRYHNGNPQAAEYLERNANEPKLPNTEPKLHWTKELRQENERLKEALDYLQFQMRVIPQSRFDKYRNANDTVGPQAYRKCAGEVALRMDGAICVSQEILDGETKWDTETRQFTD